MYTILVIEDNLPLAETIKDYFGSKEYQFTICSDGEAGFCQSRSSHFDLIIVDINLPGRNGLSIISTLRSLGQETPALILTSASDPNSLALGFQAGADAYMSKPFSMYELKLRSDALLRRPPFSCKSCFQFEDLLIDTRAMVVKRGERTIRLRKKEFAILCYLARRKGCVVTREQLLINVWNGSTEPYQGTIDVHISNIRKKIDAGFPKKLMQTIHGVGYKLTVDEGGSKPL